MFQPNNKTFKKTKLNYNYFQIEVISATDNITLHVKNLTISDKELKLYEYTEKLNIEEQIKKEREKEIYNISYVPINDFIILSVPHLVVNQKYLLKIPFEGTLESSLLGYYRSSYIDRQTNQRRYLSVTQFEPISAR